MTISCEYLLPISRKVLPAHEQQGYRRLHVQSQNCTATGVDFCHCVNFERPLVDSRLPRRLIPRTTPPQDMGEAGRPSMNEVPLESVIPKP